MPAPTAPGGRRSGQCGAGQPGRPRGLGTGRRHQGYQPAADGEGVIVANDAGPAAAHLRWLLVVQAVAALRAASPALSLFCEGGGLPNGVTHSLALAGVLWKELECGGVEHKMSTNEKLR
jgi:hypothetical protein